MRQEYEQQVLWSEAHSQGQQQPDSHVTRNARAGAPSAPAIRSGPQKSV